MFNNSGCSIEFVGYPSRKYGLWVHRQEGWTRVAFPPPSQFELQSHQILRPTIICFNSYLIVHKIHTGQSDDGPPEDLSALDTNINFRNSHNDVKICMFHTTSQYFRELKHVIRFSFRGRTFVPYILPKHFSKDFPLEPGALFPHILLKNASRFLHFTASYYLFIAVITHRLQRQP